MKNYEMFHVAHRKFCSSAVCLFFFCWAMLNSSLALAAVSDAEMARHITSLLGSKFLPESLTVTVRESQAYA